ncbi:MAG: substrate-binding domain-containing protein [Caldilineaceae bacterium]
MARALRFLAALCVLVTLAACIAPPQAGAPAATNAGGGAAKTIAIVTPYMANATTKFAIDKFQAYGKAKGWNVTVSDTNADFNQLVSRIQDAVTQKADAIVLGMGDPAQMTKGLDAAKGANIPVFGLDAGAAPGVMLNITSDNAALGQMSAHYLAEAIGGKGNVIMFTHDPHPGVRARAKAAADEFAKYPDIKIIEKKHIEVPGPVDFARSLTQDLLTAHPDGEIQGIWAGWDEPAFGAVQAIEAAGRKNIAVVGIDGTDFAKAEILKGGPFVATVQQDFDGMAKQLVDIVEKELAGAKPDKDLVTIPGKLITKENAK